MPIVLYFGTLGAVRSQGLGHEGTDWPNKPLSLPFGASDWPPLTSSPPSWRRQAVPLFPRPNVTTQRDQR